MAEENKYYVPSIEEFHVGFEFEYFMPKHIGRITGIKDNVIVVDVLEKEDEWVKCDDYTTRWSWWKAGETVALKEYLEKKEVRVKYLYQEDIEELGWGGEGSKEVGVFFINNKQGYVFRLKIYYKENRVIISSETNAPHPIDDLFKGIIKNKSRLKMIMDMCGIKKA